jgi:galactonate dehydratase
MKISGVNVYQVKGRGWPKYAWIWVEVHTDEGITGIGESAPVDGVVEALVKLGRKIAGENPFNIEKIFEESFRSGSFLPAISGVEMALWDIIGKKLGTPVYNLLGGQCHEKLRVYLDGFFRGAAYTPDEYAEKAKMAVEQGFTAIKADIDPPQIPSLHRLNRDLDLADIHLTVNVVKAVRDTIGDEIDFAVDAHGSFNPTSMVKLAKLLEPYNLMWIEDPVPRLGSNIKTLAKLTAEINTPVCVGEHLFTRADFREVFELGATDLIMPDICYTGGILEMKKIAAMADTYHIPYCPHNYLGPIATMASIQACTCAPNFVILEFQDGDVPWRDDVLSAPVPLKNGFLEIPTKPGLGVELNKEELTKHLVD